MTTIKLRVSVFYTLVCVCVCVMCVHRLVLDSTLYERTINKNYVNLLRAINRWEQQNRTTRPEMSISSNREFTKKKQRHSNNNENE